LNIITKERKRGSGGSGKNKDSDCGGDKSGEASANNRGIGGGRLRWRKKTITNQKAAGSDRNGGRGGSGSDGGDGGNGDADSGGAEQTLPALKLGSPLELLPIALSILMLKSFVSIPLLILTR